MQKFDVTEFQDDDVEVREQYQVDNIKQACKTWIITRTSIGTGKVLDRISNFQSKKILRYELKLHKAWFQEKSSKLINQRNKAKLLWFGNLGHMNRDNQNSRTSRNKNGLHETQN